MKYKVEGHPDLIRDGNSKAIINTNRSAMAEHLYKKDMKTTVQSLSEEMNTIKNEFKEIKSLLQQIASRGQ